jgi:hypothetical protein
MADGTTTSATQDASATDQVKEKAQEATEQVREQAQQAAGQARGKLRGEVDDRSTQAGRQVTGTAGDLRSVAESLRAQGQDKPAQLAEQAAQRAERLGGYLERSDSDQLLRDVEDFARRQPWVVGLGAAALGFAAARFLKASSSERYQSAQGSGFSTPPRSVSPPAGTANGLSSYGSPVPPPGIGGSPSTGF